MKFLSIFTFLLIFIFVACSEGDISPQPTQQAPTNNTTADQNNDQDDQQDNNDNSQDANVITYSGTVQAILTSNCTSCHGSSNPRAGLSLHTYATAKDGAENGAVLSRIRNSNNPMPQGGLMSEANIKAIEDWAEGGFAE
ncbi:cytochrome c [Flammeovirga sp. MY04]|uniref:c-type cytochrome n=1 Tax=Flammeovirga sp. MY04 TaxID=1191459 RepID=UPI0008064225|nr:cytochrome c [Flammeovirga sp. MY04]ANQ47835.1 cytochrome c [Flammeovirga sp. MY04]